eukprot:908-Heterococcus_DN1.PRE.4
MPAADSKTVAVQVVLRMTMTYKLAALTMLNSSSNHNSTSSTSSRVSSNSDSSSLYCCSALPLLLLVELPSLVDKQYSRTRTEAMISYEVLTYEVHALSLTHVECQINIESNAAVL